LRRLVPLHSGFDRLNQGVGPNWHVDCDAARLPRLPRHPPNQPAPFKLNDHAVDGRWRDLEEALHVGHGWRSAVDERVHVNEREVLALLLGEAGRSMTLDMERSSLCGVREAPRRRSRVREWQCDDA